VADKSRKKPPDAQPLVPSTTRWAREDEDVQLMLRFQQGERDAFDQLVQRNTHKVHALIFRFLGDPSQVEDLTQEVFLRVYRTVLRYQPTAKFSTWLYRIVANLSFNVLRSRRKVHPVQLEVPSSEEGESFYRDVPDDRHESPKADLDAGELRDKVAAAVNNLPENQKIAIILNKYEEKSYEEIAEILDLSTMAVKSLLSRARTNLRGTLMRYLRNP
jgi:RNA polymerase sigma-70 factor (ECF subfamily)